MSVFNCMSFWGGVLYVGINENFAINSSKLNINKFKELPRNSSGSRLLIHLAFSTMLFNSLKLTFEMQIKIHLLSGLSEVKHSIFYLCAPLHFSDFLLDFVPRRSIVHGYNFPFHAKVNIGMSLHRIRTTKSLFPIIK